jgi:thiamine-monophosphate kinase
VSGADEFALIARHFAPLAKNAAARGLLDDAALLDALVITADAIVEGVHFLPDDPIDTVAQKALRVNLSDIAAKGAAPVGYLLTLQWPDTRPAGEIAAFAEGLARDQATFGVKLLGGDTTRTPGPLTISVTMLGRPLGATPSRGGARAGDDLWVTGTIGDGVLGLAALRGEIGADARLVERYRRPSPRTSFAAVIARFATASLDVSDGLLGDAAKLADASGVRAVIDPQMIPLSAPAGAWRDAQGDGEAALTRLATGGDDYEILFAAAPASRAPIEEAAAEIGLRVTCIGRLEAGAGVDAGALAVGGHVHRIGA